MTETPNQTNKTVIVLIEEQATTNSLGLVQKLQDQVTQITIQGRQLSPENLEKLKKLLQSQGNKKLNPHVQQA
jgi:hypothetical protein